jgi:CubicO group peptidase (beta-lactamase class C family)
VTKTFTAAAVLRLHDAGALDVRDPIAKHLSAWPDDKSAITVHHLPTHTSGLPLDVGLGQEAIGRDELLQRARATTLTRPPGDRWAYSNLGYSLPAAIVEHVAGVPFDSFAQRELFRPAGMSGSGFSTAAGLHAYCGYRSFHSGCIRSGTAFHEGQISWLIMGGAGAASARSHRK